MHKILKAITRFTATLPKNDRAKWKGCVSQKQNACCREHPVAGIMSGLWSAMSFWCCLAPTWPVPCPPFPRPALPFFRDPYCSQGQRWTLFFNCWWSSSSFLSFSDPFFLWPFLVIPIILLPGAPLSYDIKIESPGVGDRMKGILLKSCFRKVHQIWCIWEIQRSPQLRADGLCNKTIGMAVLWREQEPWVDPRTHLFYRI